MKVPGWVYPQDELRHHLCQILDSRPQTGWTLRALAAAAECSETQFLDFARGRKALSVRRQRMLSRFVRQVHGGQIVPAAGLVNHGLDVRATVVPERRVPSPAVPRMQMAVKVGRLTGVRLEFKRERPYTHEDLWGD